MASDSTTQGRWPLLDERTMPFAQTAPRPVRRRLPRSAWILVGLAFVCGGLVSAAAFSIGWRHQAQRNTAAETALTAATARVRALRASLAEARRTAAHEHQAATTAAAAERAFIGAASRVGSDATASSDAAGSVSSGADSLTGSAARIASELKTFETYLTSTPSGQLDPGYIASQTAYLGRQLARLQAAGGALGGSVTSLDAAIRKLTGDAAALKSR
jgi:hypothetical protein